MNSKKQPVQAVDENIRQACNGGDRVWRLHMDITTIYRHICPKEDNMAAQVEQTSPAVAELSKKLLNVLTSRASRKLFFSTLSRLLQAHFHFDRLCINLYDQQGEMLTYFTAAEGTIISTLSPVRPAEPSSTVAGHVIATRRPVIITDFAQHFPESTVHPIAEAGLASTMAFPLTLDNEIIATLHCSFARTPDSIYAIASFLSELAPTVAVCLGAILSLEQMTAQTQLRALPLFSQTSEERVICHSPRMREVIRRVDIMAKLNIPILLLGETGTGKSLLAQDIHRRSPRKEAQFVRVNCPSLAQSLFESELFGHAKGAFTGAANKRIGRFELANGGTLFLDEIAELSPEMQSKLLQVLEDSSFERVGESVPLAVDVRIVAATNVHVGATLASGKLRADLFYRLSPCTIELPPLRERIEDIPPLVAMLSGQTAASLGLPQVHFSPQLMRHLLDYEWPGNVRELRNIVGRLVVHHGIRNALGSDDVAEAVAESRKLLCRRADAPADAAGPAAQPKLTPPAPGMPETAKTWTLADMERRHIQATLARTGGIIAGPAGAATLLGLPRSTLLHRMRKLGIELGPRQPRSA